MLKKEKIKPSLFVAVLPFVFLIVVMLIGNIGPIIFYKYYGSVGAS